MNTGPTVKARAGLLIGAMIASGAIGAGAFWLLAGHEGAPGTHAECKAEASKRPTERGVSVALGECTRIFVTEPEQRAKEERKRRMASAWESLEKGGVTLEQLIKRIGEGSAQASNPGPCAKLRDETPPPGPCVFHRWVAEEYSAAAAPNSFGYTDFRTYLQAEVDSSTGVIRAWYKEAAPANQLAWH